MMVCLYLSLQFSLPLHPPFFVSLTGLSNDLKMTRGTFGCGGIGKLSENVYNLSFLVFK